MQLWNHLFSVQIIIAVRVNQAHTNDVPSIEHTYFTSIFMVFVLSLLTCTLTHTWCLYIMAA